MKATHYVSILLVTAAICAPLFMFLRVMPIGCPTARPPGTFLAFCGNQAYQDFEHGAYAFGLRPDAEAATKQADVIFFGNSRSQVAFSTSATRNAFASTPLRYYLLGFGYIETDGFAETLIQHLKLRPKAAVINVDTFFLGTLSEPAMFVREHPMQAELEYRLKALGAALFKTICPASATWWPCAGAVALIRDDATGAWTLSLPGSPPEPVAFDQANGRPLDASPFISNARSFLAQLGTPPSCVVLTTVPTPQQSLDPATVQQIAESLGTRWIEPEVAHLDSFDGSHLSRDSAERWSSALLAEAMPVLRQCSGR